MINMRVHYPLLNTLSLTEGDRVRVTSTNPVFNERTGHIVAVEQSKLNTTYRVQFVGDERVLGGFTQDMLTRIRPYVRDLKLHQIDDILEAFRGDLDCWMHEAFAAYKIAKSTSN